ncbi:alpha-ketoglutarate-dependent dioxygenase alkB homolog 4 [Planococcus citri]|uniref:alpha-ketoglutarate-dependent dioxygenase alkB homolog 4 n=1 Tax=Planococcus citri TaxID=170843 RepID=UPI0031F75E73
MDRSKYCGCKGIRTCLQCEEKYGLKENQNLITNAIKSFPTYVYCIFCDKVFAGQNADEYLHHPNHRENGYQKVSGVYVFPEFITDDEEKQLIDDLDAMPWDISQSGRRKQNFGPNCNFKKRKLKPGAFKGFPSVTEFIQKRFNEVPLLKGYRTIEQCSLEYDPHRGASIDPHIDDCWIWGERIVTVNLLSDTVLILTKYKGDKSRYNLQLAPNIDTDPDDIAIRIPMPRKSLVILCGDARYNWEHCILREDIQKRRVCLAYREFTPDYLPGGKNAIESEMILKLAENFW